MYVCMSVCMHACMQVGKYVCMYVCMYLQMCVDRHVYELPLVFRKWSQIEAGHNFRCIMALIRSLLSL